MRTTLWGLLAVTTLLAAGCSARSDGEPGAIGQLALPLATHGASGATYRLRNANFEIHSAGYYGYAGPAGAAGATGATGAAGAGGAVTPASDLVSVVSSESEPDAESIAVDLEEGQYYIVLDPGWSMEKVDAGVTSTVEATLLSSQTVWVYVYPHSTSWAAYQFGIGSADLWLNGKLNIEIQVAENPDQYYNVGGFGGVANSPSYGGMAGAPSYGGMAAGGAAAGGAAGR